MDAGGGLAPAPMYIRATLLPTCAVVQYFEATCDRIDLDANVVHCTSKNSYEDGFTPQFQVQ